MKAQGYQTVTRSRAGKDGDPGVSAFKSVVFKRSNEDTDAPVGGTYHSPVPSGWSDGVPGGEEELWMSTRIFTNTGGAPQQADGEDKEVHNRRGPGCPLPSGAVVPGQPLDTERLPPRRPFRVPPHLCPQRY